MLAQACRSVRPSGSQTRARMPRRAVVLLAGLAAVPHATPLHAQDPLILINRETTVRSVRFSFEDEQTFTREELSNLITYTDPGLFAGLRRLAGALPLVSDRTEQTFRPVELQRDLARLRRFYRNSGFPDVQLRYAVRFDRESNQVRIRHVIREGEPLRRGALDVAYRDGGSTPDFLPNEELRDDWSRLIEMAVPRAGERIGELERVELAEEFTRWLANRGWAFATVRAEASVDSTSSIADVRLVVDPGPLTRVDEIRVVGNQRVSGWVARRAIPLKPGDVFSAASLARGEQQLVALDLVRFARAQIVPDQPIDSTVTLVARIEEGLPRIVSGETGLATETGVSAEASWAHRDFVGDARTLTVTATAQTNWLGFAGTDRTLYGASVSLKQPLLFGANTTGVARPFIDYRDDVRDRSWIAGTDLTFIYQPRSNQTLSIGYGLSQRRVLEYRGAGAADLDLFARLALADSLASNVRTHALTVAWLSDRVNNTRSPTSGHTLSASTQFAGPSGISSVTYARLDLSAAGFVPLAAESTLAVRFGLGRLFPMGQSVPRSPDDQVRAFLLLRDAVFTAGGSYGVRGWGERLLGPKTPDARGDLDAPETLTADRYVPIGGLARTHSTVELRLPMPFVGPPHGVHGFVDMGRVWNPDSRFLTGGPDEARPFFSTGGGIEFATPVGPIRLTLGYKLNPSELDLRDANDVLQALLNDESILDVPERGLRRLHVHLTIGRTF